MEEFVAHYTEKKLLRVFVYKFVTNNNKQHLVSVKIKSEYKAY